MKILSSIIIVLCLACSETKPEANTFEDDSSQSNSLPKNWIEYEMTYQCDNLIKIKTTYLEVDDTISFRGFVVKNQDIIIEKEDKSQIKIELPFEYESISIEKDLIPVLLTSISKIQCLKVNGKTILKLYGTNFFDPHHEFLGLFSLDGDWLWYYYGTMYESYKEIGKKHEWNRKIGEDKINNLNDMINVLPRI